MIDLLPKTHIVGSDVSSALGIPENSTADAAFLALSGSCRVETGSYRGNGANSRTITFQKTPRFLLIRGYASLQCAEMREFIYPCTDSGENHGTNYSRARSSVTWGDNSVKLEKYNDTASDWVGCFNSQGQTYYYFAITE